MFKTVGEIEGRGRKKIRREKEREKTTSESSSVSCALVLKALASGKGGAPATAAFNLHRRWGQAPRATKTVLKNGTFLFRPRKSQSSCDLWGLL